VERQILLINDLLDISRLQTGRINYKLENFSLDGAISEIVGSLQPIFDQKKEVKLIINDGHDTLVQGDKGWVSRILGNLISNALKYTDKGNVTITSRRGASLVEIIVS